MSRVLFLCHLLLKRKTFYLRGVHVATRGHCKISKSHAVQNKSACNGHKNPNLSPKGVRQSKGLAHLQMRWASRAAAARLAPRIWRWDRYREQRDCFSEARQSGLPEELSRTFFRIPSSLPPEEMKLEFGSVWKIESVLGKMKACSLFPETAGTLEKSKC